MTDAAKKGPPADGRTPTGAASATPPVEHVGPFRLGDLLGRGGMGVVHAATRAEDARSFAVKLLRTVPGDPTGLHEIQAAARLGHPHIVGVEAWGTVGDLLWIAMPRITGRSLNEVFPKLSAPARLVVVRQLLDALAYAHDRGVVHRDLKPENVIVATSASGAPHAWLMDFGIATIAPAQTLGADGGRDDGRRGVPGTPAYMAPEQARGGPVGPEADLYALGVMIFQAFAGRLPFEGPPLQVIVAKTRAPAPPLVAAPDRPLPPGLAELVARLLATHPLDRPPSASAVDAELADILRRTDHPVPSAAPRETVEVAQPTMLLAVSPTALGEATAVELTPELAGHELTGRTAEALAGLVERARAVAASGRAARLTLVGTPGERRDALASGWVGALEAEGWACLVGGAGVDASAAGAPRSRGPFGDALGRWSARAAEEARRPGAPDDLAAEPALAREMAGFAGERDAYELTLAPALCPPPDEVVLLMRLVETLAKRRPVLVLLGGGETTRSRVRRFLAFAAERLCEAPALLAELAPPGDAEGAVERLSLAAVESVPQGSSGIAGVPNERARRTLRMAACLGEIFPRALLEAVGGAPEDIDRLLAGRHLVTTHVAVVAGTAALQFAGGEERRALRAECPVEEMTGVQVAAEAWLDARAAALTPLGLRALGELCRASGRWRRAMAWHLRAGRRLEVQGDVPGALEIYRAVVAELDRLWPALAEPDAAFPRELPVDVAGLLVAGARAAFEQGEMDDAGRWAARALLRNEPGRSLVRAEARRLLAEIHWTGGEHALAVHHLDAALDELGSGGDRIMRALLLGRRGWLVGYVLGRPDAGRADVEAAFRLLGELDAPAVAAQTWSNLGAVELRAGRWDHQLAANERALALATEAGDTAGRIRGHINLGVCLHNRGRLEEAAQQTNAALELAALAGIDTRRVIAANNLGLIRLDQDRLDEAEAAFESSAALAERCRARGVLFETRGGLARVALRRGDRARAAEQADRGVVEARLTGSPAADAHAARVRALVEAASGRPAAARALLEAAVVRVAASDAYESAVTRLALATLTGTPTASLETELRTLGAEPALERRRWAPVTSAQASERAPPSRRGPWPR
jgi:serine/threonine-protein kinase